MRRSFDSLSRPDSRSTGATARTNSLVARREPRSGNTAKSTTKSKADGDNWRNLANCRGRIELFFAKRAERPEARARREAKALTLCSTCEVTVQCREFARRHHEYGFWAGESEEDRHVLGFTVSAPIGTRSRRNDEVRHTGTTG